jgi:D-3-phosphoglycerate dehydrogenase
MGATGSDVLGKVLITTPSFAQYSTQPWEALRAARLSARRSEGSHPLAPSALAQQVGDADALLVGLDRIDATVLDAGRSIRVVAKHGVGTDNIDLDAARVRGIRVVNAPGGNAESVADLTIGLLLAVTRQLVPAHASVVAGRWDRFFGPQLSGRTMGIVGFGRIGQAVARRAVGFGPKLLAYDPYVPPQVFAAAGVQPASLDDLLATCNVVTLHVPSSPGAAPIIDADTLSRMPVGTVLVNAARGDLVDSPALSQALHEGRLSGYAADAFAVEPPARDDPLLTAPNTLFTPHIGAFTDAANAAMGTTVVADIARVLAGDAPENAVV